jgi:hypothetical protein
MEEIKAFLGNRIGKPLSYKDYGELIRLIEHYGFKEYETGRGW